ncbi:MAG: class I SAM-dependent methyltransferase [Vicingaceae bacterium]|nr:class I SAM-dependent methyltransferase [Vicingaceae bacterium]
MNKETIAFIKDNKHKKVNDIALLLSKKENLDANFIINQINGWQKAKNKLPTFYNTPEIIFPSVKSMEQCSSEKTGLLKTKMVSGNSLVDLTGGFGIDTYFFSKHFKTVHYVEPNKELLQVAQHNFNLLGAKIKLHNLTSEAFLNSNKTHFDVAYIDPDRRDESKRIFNLSDCSPNVIKLIPLIFKSADKLLIKASPFLDIKQSLEELKNVSKCYVVAVKNDCKEVLYLVEKEKNKPTEIISYNLDKNEEVFKFIYEEEQHESSNFSHPKKYLYEPNAAIMKAGAFKIIGKRFSLYKLAQHTHLYTSNELINDFPGRIFEVSHVTDYQKKAIQQLGIKKANISTRNFPDTVAVIKKKLNLKDGGDCYLFAATNLDNKPILIITKK